MMHKDRWVALHFWIGALAGMFFFSIFGAVAIPVCGLIVLLILVALAYDG